MTYRLNLWFPELQHEPPCYVLWSAKTPDVALRECQREYPMCRVELVGPYKG